MQLKLHQQLFCPNKLWGMFDNYVSISKCCFKYTHYNSSIPIYTSHDHSYCRPHGWKHRSGVAGAPLRRNRPAHQSSSAPSQQQRSSRGIGWRLSQWLLFTQWFVVWHRSRFEPMGEHDDMRTAFAMNANRDTHNLARTKTWSVTQNWVIPKCSTQWRSRTFALAMLLAGGFSGNFILWDTISRKSTIVECMSHSYTQSGAKNKLKTYSTFHF